MSFQAESPGSAARQGWAQHEEQHLAPYAMRTQSSRGRRVAEPPHAYRTAYMRDRDRIIHCSAFRRLMYKTQVFIGQPSDHQRNRLTHTLEVAQIARTVARHLRLNEDLTETIALAHDLGHPPFGHAGERALAERMAGVGGFEHNRQGLRLLEELEQPYAGFNGLNLTYELLESLALRSKTPTAPDLADFCQGQQMLLESQVVDAADSIAYNTHDIDDALRAGLIDVPALERLPIWQQARERAIQLYGTALAESQLVRGILRALIDGQVDSLLAESQQRLAAVQSVAAVRQAAAPLIVFRPELEQRKTELEAFLMAQVYRHASVVRTTRVAERMIRHLFDELVRDPAPLSERFQRRLEAEPRERVVCDYVAGMTDRFAQRLHRALFQP